MSLKYSSKPYCLRNIFTWTSNIWFYYNDSFLVDPWRSRMLCVVKYCLRNWWSVNLTILRWDDHAGSGWWRRSMCFGSHLLWARWVTFWIRSKQTWHRPWFQTDVLDSRIWSRNKFNCQGHRYRGTSTEDQITILATSNSLHILCLHWIYINNRTIDIYQ